MNLSDYDTFILDWDGTLSRLGHLYKINRTLNPYWLYRKSQVFRRNRRVSESELERLLDDIYLSGKERVDKAEISIMVKLVDIFNRMFKPRLNYGARELLEELAKRRKKVYIFTDGNIKRVKNEVRKLGVSVYIFDVVSAQSLGRLKPDPLGILLILRKSNTKKVKSIMVGDTYDDILAAKRAGISSCAVASGLSSPSSLKESGADLFFNNIFDLYLALKKKKKRKS